MSCPTLPGARPASSTFSLSDSPGSSNSLFLSLSGAASPYSSSVSCGGSYYLGSSNLPESPSCFFKSQQQNLTLCQQQQFQQPQQQQQQQYHQIAVNAEGWRPNFLQLPSHEGLQPPLQAQCQPSIGQQPSEQLVASSQGDAIIWDCLDQLTRSDERDGPEVEPQSQQQQPQQQQQLVAAFEDYRGLSGRSFSVRPQMLAECRGDSLHNRIFERGENYFGFSAEDRQLLESAISPEHPLDTAAAHSTPNPLLTHFPRRKLDADLRVPATVYLDDNGNRRQLTLDVSCEAPVSKLLVRCQAIGMPPGQYPHPCAKCSDSHGSLLVSIASHSLEGLVHVDYERQQSSLYVIGQPECGRMWLTLRYNCSQDHLRNSQRLTHLALANLITVIEAFDQFGCLIGRASYRVRVVASPARDLLRFLTNQLTPAQTGCTLGQCAHLAARWKSERFRQLPDADLRWCLDQFRFKDELRAELEARLSCRRSVPGAVVKRQRIEEEAPKQAQQKQDLQQMQQQNNVGEQPQRSGLQLLPDGSLLISSPDRAKMARIRGAVAAILAEQQSEEAAPIVTMQQQQQQPPPPPPVPQQARSVSTADAMAFQPIILIRPYCQF